MDNIVGWEIHGWGAFFINIAVGNFEIQINKYREETEDKEK